MALDHGTPEKFSLDIQNRQQCTMHYALTTFITQVCPWMATLKTAEFADS